MTLLKKKEETNKNKTPAITIIQELESNSTGIIQLNGENGDPTAVSIEDIDDDELDWNFPQEIRSSPSESLLHMNKFGFNNKFHDYFDDLMEVYITNSTLRIGL